MAQIPFPAEQFPLSKAQRQQAVVVSQIDLPPRDELRMKVMGICVGRPLNIIRVGDPLIVMVSGARVVMSRGLADAILVNPVLPANGPARAVS